MSFTKIEPSTYYPDDYDYSLYYQNELQKYQNPSYTPNQKVMKPSTINYLNERKCPIYVHRIKADSSVYNNYGLKLATPRKTGDAPKPAPQNASKFVLDKLEETYWATWKPKRENGTSNNLRTPRKVQNVIYPGSRPVFLEHNKVPKNHLNQSHGDVNDDIIKYFKAPFFYSGSTTDSINHQANQNKSNNLLPKKSEITRNHGLQGGAISKEIKSENKRDKKLDRPSNSRKLKITKQPSISQEIQTEVHCPVILQEPKEAVREEQVDPESNIMVESQDELSEKVDDWNRRNNEETVKVPKRKGKGKKQPKEGRQPKKETKQQGMPVITEGNSESITTFVDHKDSIEITKKKQEKSDPKEHFPQPKCIRLYRKSGLAAGYIKGGTYPLKSCLKKDGSPKGNFKLGAPGSTLFVTTSSFSGRRRK